MASYTSEVVKMKVDGIIKHIEEVCKLKVAIVDHNKITLEMIRGYVLHNTENIDCSCAAFQKSRGLLNALEDNCRYDLYFIEIEQQETGGFELARKIRKLQKSAYIVFTASGGEFALDTYDLSIKAYYYIVKNHLNHMKREISEVLAAVSAELEEKKEDFYVIQNKLRFEKIKISDIIYVFKNEKNSVFMTKNGKVLERKALRKVVQSLNRPEFVFLNAGCAINIKYIRRISDSTILLADGTSLYGSSQSIRKVKSSLEGC